MRGKVAPRSLGVAVAALADRQHGVVGSSQLHELGLSRHVIQRWLHDGRLHPVHRGVYAVGRSRLVGPS